MSTVIIEDHTDEVLAGKNAAVMRALEAVGLQAEGYAKLLAPVDTGLLRNSITHAVSGKPTAIKDYKSSGSHAVTPATIRAGTAGKSAPIKKGSYSFSAPDGEDAVYVGTNVEYAPYVELGTRRSAAQPFLKPAIENHLDEYKALIKSFLQD